MAEAATELLCRVPLDNGDVLFVQSISVFARKAFMQQAEQLYPKPDPEDEQYKIPLKGAPPELEAYEPVDENPAYRRAMAQSLLQRTNYLYNAVLDFGAVVDSDEGKNATIARYAPKLALVEGAAGIPPDEWQATVKLCCITTADDVRRIYRVACEALEQEDILKGVEFFRRAVQRDSVSGNPRQQKPSRAAKTTRPA
jgi:hypothetical protein